MINYIGQFKKEKSNSEIRLNLKKQKSFFTLLLLAFPLIFLLFDYEILKSAKKSPEKISGDRMATCKLTLDDNSSCTAFLVSESGLLITARHCVETNPEAEYTLNFDMIEDPKFHNLKATVVYFPENEDDDFAVLKFKDNINNIKPLKISGTIANPSSYNPKITIIGYPGITQKQSIDNQNSVINYSYEDSTVFIVNQSYQGYSGSPVIDTEKGVVIGILTSGFDSRHIGTRYEPFIGMAFCEKIQQVFDQTPHLAW